MSREGVAKGRLVQGNKARREAGSGKEWYDADRVYFIKSTRYRVVDKSRSKDKSRSEGKSKNGLMNRLSDKEKRETRQEENRGPTYRGNGDIGKQETHRCALSAQSRLAIQRSNVNKE